MYTLSELWIYPIKSLGGIALTEAKVEMRGLQHDRRWMLVDENGRFLTQREIAALALLRTQIVASHLLVFHKENPADAVRIPFEIPDGELEKTAVEIWDDTCAATVLPKLINDWFSNV